MYNMIQMLPSWAVTVFLLALFGSNVRGHAIFEVPNNSQELIAALNRGDVEQLENVIAPTPSIRNYNLFLLARSNWTLLHEIAYQGLAGVITKFAETGTIDLTPISDDGDTPLHIAVRYGQVEIVDEFISVATIRGNLANLLEVQNPKTGNSPIFEAAGEEINSTVALDMLKCAAKLVHAGASLHQPENADGLFPIHFAMLNGRLDFVKMALAKNASLAKQLGGLQSNRKTLGHFAAQTNSVKFLEDMGDWFEPAAVDAHGQTAACYVAAKGHFSFAKAMVEMGHAGSLISSDPICYYNLEHYPHLTGSPLHVVAMRRYYGFVGYLLKTGADLNAKDSSGGTILHSMAMAMDAEKVQQNGDFVYDYELDVNQTAGQDEITVRLGKTPVVAKIPDTQKDKRLITYLIEKDMSLLESRDADGYTPFLASVFYGAEDLSTLLLTDFRVNLSSVSDSGYSALHLANDAIQFHNLFSLRENVFIIGVDTPSFAGTDSLPGFMTPLMVAVEEKKPMGFIEYLIQVVNANATLTNDHGQSLAHLAVKANYKVLIEEKAELLDFETFDNTGMSAIHYAVEQGKLEILKPIVAAKPTVTDRQTLLEQTAPFSMAMSNNLHLAVLSDQPEVVEFLMDIHPNLIFRKDALGRSAAHLAVKCENTRMLFTMLDKLDDPSLVTSLTDNYGKTLLMLAVERDCLRLSELLLTKYNSSCTQTAVDSLTPLDHAKSVLNWKMANALVATGKCSVGANVQCDLSTRDGAFVLGKIASLGSPVLPPGVQLSLGASVSSPSSNVDSFPITCSSDSTKPDYPGGSFRCSLPSYFATIEESESVCNRHGEQLTTVATTRASVPDTTTLDQACQTYDTPRTRVTAPDHLIRHHVSCPSGRLLTFFRLHRPSPTQMSYEYTCCRPQQMHQCVEKVNPVTMSSLNAHHLDRQNIDCGPGYVINSFRLEDVGGQWRYRYDCCAASTENCVVQYTDENDGGRGNVYYLDRHILTCPNDQVMQQFQLKNLQMNIRYKYTCCETTLTCPNAYDTVDRILSCDAGHSSVSLDCQYEHRVGASAIGTGSSQSISMETSKVLEKSFANFGVSASTNHDWAKETSASYESERSTTASLSCPAGSSCQMDQVVGYCGNNKYRVRSNEFRLTTTKPPAVGSTYDYPPYELMEIEKSRND